jgi:hypothetical protein
LGKIKDFLKRDSDILRNTILFLFGLSFGIDKLIYDHRVLSKVLGLLLFTGSIVLLVDIIKEIKRQNKVIIKLTSNNMRWNMERLQCPCCENFTVESDDEVIVDICDVCFWQYDAIAHELPDRNIGANHISLTQAKENYRQFGVCKKVFIHMVRGPLDVELPKNNLP